MYFFLVALIEYYLFNGEAKQFHLISTEQNVKINFLMGSKNVKKLGYFSI